MIYLKKIFLLFLSLFICYVISPIPTKADMGPKPTLTIVAKNMPQATCYLDLLIRDASENIEPNINHTQEYNAQLLNSLQQYNVDGWHAAMASGTSVPLFGDILCDTTNRECSLTFTYMGVPDQFKIIVVSADSQTVVSNIVDRKAFNSTVTFDYKTGEASEQSPKLSYFLQLISTCSATLIIEGLLLLMFSFSLNLNWKPFVLINILTQILLTLVISSAMYFGGILLALVLYIPFELVIFIIEAVLFAYLLKQHSKTRRVIYSLTANVVSFIAGFILMFLY
jgi:hypothetical protein